MSQKGVFRLPERMRRENPALKVGVTGNIGSGKTLVCRMFAELGIPVYYADERAKAMLTSSKPLVRAIKRLFGEAAYLPDGSLDRRHIADLAFADGKKLEQLNALIHPAVLRDGERWHLRQRGVPYTLKESALLFEISSQHLFDKIIAVKAPEEIRLQRAMLRDGLPEEAVRARMAKQLPDEVKSQLADFVIINDGERLLLPQVLDIHRQLLAIAQTAHG